ncbi:hypothetical protein [Candidatus Venteria ishoeyi]|uniref:Uncharacterized protein n=1 Tax=Candidatus Venteria ishoeyi TaxID=1899563 RepID=A0A1H6F9B6_9GAMM|nr:hypothetical protein [Candidatus Venteria ishoeyi]MDM8545177.1 hypothetical protein [Candidatus Venteria ishoeyi]SEH06697.1 Uncharacterised protein [Candidatus Venteria ishoeyi]
MATERKILNARHRAKRSTDHTLKNVWIPSVDIKRLEKLAKKRGWLAATGRNAGQVNFQQAINEVLKAGLSALKA